MNIYVLNVILTLLWAGILLVKNRNRKKQIAFCSLISIQWILISGLRGMSVSPDMFSYRFRFNNTLQTSWNSVFKGFYEVYVNEEGKDPGYTLFEKITQIFVQDFQAYLVIVAVIFFVLLAVWIYKNSAMPCLSYLIFSAYLFGFYAITGTRQTIATALVVLIGTEFIKKRKFIPFLIVCAIAFTIHKSSMVFFLLYFVSKKEITWKYITGVVCAFPLLFIFRNQYVQLLNYISGYEYDAMENAGAYGFMTMYLLVTIASIALLKYIKARCPNYKLYYNALFLGLIFIPIVFVHPTMMRVVQYFSMFIMLLIPELVRSFEKNLRPPVYFFLVSALFAVSNIYRYSYEFYWQ